MRVLMIFTFALFAHTAAHAQANGVMMVVKGEVSVTNSAGKTEAAKVGKKVVQGDTITAGKDSRAKIVMSDKNVINVSPDSKIKIEKYETGATKNVELKVEYGKVRASVEQKYDGDKNKFNIKTPSAVAGVRGTDFMTGYNPNTRVSQVVTFSGAVAMGTPGPGGSIQNPVFVKPGQMSEAGAGQRPSAPRAVPKEEMNKMNNESKADGPAAKQDDSKSSDQAKKDDKKEDKKSDEKKEAKKDDVKKDEPKKDEAKADEKKEAKKDEVTKDEPKKDAKKDAPKKEAAPAAGNDKKDEPKKDQASTNGGGTSGAASGDRAPASDGSASGGSASGGSASGGSASGGSASGGSASGGSASGGSASGGSASGGSAPAGGSAPGPAPATKAPPPTMTPTSGGMISGKDLGTGPIAGGNIPTAPTVPVFTPPPTIPVIPTVPTLPPGVNQKSRVTIILNGQ
jgi:hypothetical protein